MEPRTDVRIARWPVNLNVTMLDADARDMAGSWLAEQGFDSGMWGCKPGDPIPTDQQWETAYYAALGQIVAERAHLDPAQYWSAEHAPHVFLSPASSVASAALAS